MRSWQRCQPASRPLPLPCATVGPLEEGERLIAPVRKFGPPLTDLIRPMSYLDLTTMIDATSPSGRHYHEKSSSLKDLNALKAYLGQQMLYCKHFPERNLYLLNQEYRACF